VISLWLGDVCSKWIQAVIRGTTLAPWDHYRNGREGEADRPIHPEAVEVLRNAGIVQRMLLGISGPCDTGRSDPAQSRPCVGSNGLGMPGSVSGGDVDGSFVATLDPGAPDVGNFNGPMLQSLGRQGVQDSPFDFRGFRAPFLYSTNGELFWFHDIRDQLS
jgi:hypothetical protein